MLIGLVFILICVLSFVNGLQNLAQGKAAFQTDDYSELHIRFSLASNAVDGNTNQDFFAGSCSHTDSAEGAWWEVDLGDTYDIDNVKIYNRYDQLPERLQNVQLYIGYGNSEYVLRGYHPGAIGSTYTFRMTPTVYGRWVRITRIGAPGPLHMCEVQVFGDKIVDVRLPFISSHIGTGMVLASMVAGSSTHCCSLCVDKPRCVGVNYYNVTGICDQLETTASSIDSTFNGRFYKYP